MAQWQYFPSGTREDAVKGASGRYPRAEFRGAAPDVPKRQVESPPRADSISSSWAAPWTA